MEANPEIAEEVGEQLFDVLVKVAASPAHPTSFVFTGDALQYQKFDGVDGEVQSVIRKFDGDVTYSDLSIDSQKRWVMLRINLNEPAFSNHVFGHLKLVNDQRTRQWLIQSNYKDAINPGGVYACHLDLKPNTADVYLHWDGGNELLYRFESMSSTRYRFFRYLLENPDMVHSLASLKDRSVVPASTKLLHEYFTKTFMTGTLKDIFAIVSEKENIGIKRVVQLRGIELIFIIRSNLVALENAQSRHLVRKVQKKLVKHQATLYTSAATKV